MSWLDWLFTPVCPLCQRPTASGDGCFCRDCAAQLRSVKQANWRLSQLRISEETSLPVIGWGVYRDTLRRALRSLKYEHHPEVGETLGRWMGQRWLSGYPAIEPMLLPNNRKKASAPTRRKRITIPNSVNKASRQPTYLVVPIPLHSVRRQERGFNQAEVISRAFCGVTSDRLRLRLLRRQQATQPQFGLSAQERSKNVETAFVADACDRQRWPILLVDDIYTTGATVAAAQYALESQGWRVDAALVVAMAEMEESS
ncbi:MAG: ComF family protein [Synechococcus sp.]